jgi:EpsI family protein
MVAELWVLARIQLPGSQREATDDFKNEPTTKGETILTKTNPSMHVNESRAVIRATEAKTQTKSSVIWQQFCLAALILCFSLVISLTVEFRVKVPASQSFEHFPSRIGQWQGSRQFMGREVLDSLDLSDYVIKDYHNPEGKTVNLYIAYYESQSKGESIHSPSSCLPGGGWVFHESGVATIPLNGHKNTYTRINRALIQKGDAKRLSYFWFPMRGRVATNLWEMKLFNFWDALTRQRTDGALVRLITPLSNGERLETAEARMQAFTEDLVPVLDEFLPK